MLNLHYNAMENFKYKPNAFEVRDFFILREEVPYVRSDEGCKGRAGD